MSHWNIEKSTDLYGIEYWGDPYFKVNDKGNVIVTPEGPESKGLDLFELVNDLKERGNRTPLLIRFPNIIESRIKEINSYFKNAIDDCKYQGAYQGVYPIKVNQQCHLVQEIVQKGAAHGFGLECGSKPELLITMAMAVDSEAHIICNGFKDKEYIEMALLSVKMGRNTTIVVDRFSELELIINAAEKFQIKPKIGLRTKLNTQSEGKWVESSGTKSKFGLSPGELVEAVNVLKKKDLLDCLHLLHFHVGSQIPSIQSIKSALKEGVRYYTELVQMGARMGYIDVGGGLGVDYDGSGKSDSSTNYTGQEYANDVVSIIQSICDEKDVRHPNIISESGRFIVAPCSVLVFDILGTIQVSKATVNLSGVNKPHQLLKDLVEIYENVNTENVNEFYNDLVEKKRDTLQLFKYGVLSLEQRAIAEDICWAISKKIAELSQGNEELEDIFWNLESEMTDIYFGNFSIFQSLPDSWALQQVFPVMPIQKLGEFPSRRAKLVDLTCDSDGELGKFIDIDTGETQKYLEIHDVEPNEPYFIGVFLTGAYQETLGDLHNLFGDTDAVHVTTLGDQYCVDHVVKGDTVREVLSYVEYDPTALMDKVRKVTDESISLGRLTPREARILVSDYEKGLNGYTYLREEDD